MSSDWTKLGEEIVKSQESLLKNLDKRISGREDHPATVGDVSRVAALLAAYIGESFQTLYGALELQAEGEQEQVLRRAIADLQSQDRRH